VVRKLMDVTIAVCTRDRAQRLDRLLRSFCQLEAPDGVTWEVLIIDNGSTDSTEDVIKSYRDRLPLRWASEPLPGISHARNRALNLATGDLLVFTDDDCTVEASWLKAYLRATDRYPLAAVYAGPVVARLVGPPSKLADALLTHAPNALTNFTFGEDDIRIDHNSHISRIPYGANFAVRRRAISGMQFDTNLGRTSDGGVLLGGEETRFISNLLYRGHAGWLLPDAPVEHWNEPDRVSFEYLARYCYAAGLQWGVCPEGPVPLLAMRRLWTNLLLKLAKLAIGRRSLASRVKAVRKLSTALGALDSRFINPASRMVDASGRILRSSDQ
jgi:glycosyltransferase involved in cell wall biosynthesis